MTSYSNCISEGPTKSKACLRAFGTQRKVGPERPGDIKIWLTAYHRLQSCDPSLCRPGPPVSRSALASVQSGQTRTLQKPSQHLQSLKNKSKQTKKKDLQADSSGIRGLAVKGSGLSGNRLRNTRRFGPTWSLVKMSVSGSGRLFMQSSAYQSSMRTRD